MKKSVMRSAKPYWIYLIITGKKTVEVGKDFPKSEDWDRTVEMYCSKDKRSFNRIPEADREWMSKYLGKVACKFVCDEIIDGKRDVQSWVRITEESCVPAAELYQYCGEDENGETKYCYGWHISQLEVYDDPKKLCVFKTPPCEKPETYCCKCKYFEVHNTPEYYETDCWGEDGVYLERPPQSWFYIGVSYGA